MKLAAFAAAAAIASAPVAARGDAGPIKHWGTFPDHEIRAVSMRGERFGGENFYTAVQARDGYVYVRGRLYLYRVLDATGRTQSVADTSQCSGWFESQGVDDRPRVPRALCTRAAEIIVAASTRHDHLRVPTPAWSGAFGYMGGYRVDNRYLTSVVPAAGGGYWFGFRVPGAVGRVWPSGRAVLHRVPGIGTVEQIVASGDEVYVADDECRIVHLRGFAILERDEKNLCRPSARRSQLVLTRDGAVWILSQWARTVERRGVDGSRKGWELPMSPDSVVVSRDGTAYVLGGAGDPRYAHPTIATIVPGQAPQVRVLPMRYADTIAIDGRDRLWISDAFDHAFAVVTPVGARR